MKKRFVIATPTKAFWEQARQAILAARPGTYTFEFYGDRQAKVDEWKLRVGENVAIASMQLGGRVSNDGRVWMTLQGWFKVIASAETVQPTTQATDKQAETKDSGDPLPF